jgi:threonine dehydratase
MLLSDSVTITDVEAAQKRLLGIAHQTPVITSNTFNKLTKSQVFFKCENFQRTGAFKFRGAYNALVQLSAQQKIEGVITYSSGNHGQAIALAGKLLNIPTIVVMPDDAPIVKQTATRGYGAEVILYSHDTTNRERLTKSLAVERELTLIPPYDHPHIIAGQGTTALELIQEVGQLDYLLVCCGGGGLISGCAITTKAVLPNCKIIGVEPELADDATRSFYTKTLQVLHNPHTIADGARTPSLGKITFPLVLEYVDDMVTVSDAAIIRTMFLIWERLQQFAIKSSTKIAI